MMKWISIKDEMPEPAQRVKLHHVALGEVTGIFNGLMSVWFVDDWGPAPEWRVTHWQPLPEPPE